MQRCESKCDSLKKNWRIVLLTWEHHVFPEFLKWLITYFQQTCRSPVESDCPYNKKQGLMSMSFPLGWCDHSTHSSHGPNVEKRPFTIRIGRFVFQDFSQSVKLFWNWNSYQGPVPSFLIMYDRNARATAKTSSSKSKSWSLKSPGRLAASPQIPGRFVSLFGCCWSHLSDSTSIGTQRSQISCSCL
jgi:hypothetical protein